MDDRKVGEAIRRIRHELGLRQVDLAAAAGRAQATISEIERGHVGSMTVDSVRSVAAALGATLGLEVRWRGADLARLLDREHARIVESVVGVVRTAGWEVTVEWSFSHFGERGSIDVLGWSPIRRALLIVEVKSQLVDLQDLLATLDRKARLAPKLLAGERGWRPEIVGKIVVVRDSTVTRSIVSAHARTFASALPARSRECRAWLRDPARPLAGLWFLSDITGDDSGTRSPASGRVRGPVRTRPERGAAPVPE